jgi:hypothetical protein
MTILLGGAALFGWVVFRGIRFARGQIDIRPELRARVSSWLDRLEPLFGPIIVVVAIGMMGWLFTDSVMVGRRGSFYAKECEPLCEAQNLEVYRGTEDECVCGSVIAKAPCTADLRTSP